MSNAIKQHSLRRVSDDFIGVHTVYLITNNDNGNQYVGLTNDLKRRIVEHVTPKNINNRTTVLSRALRKYGVMAFTFSVLEVVIDTADLPEREMHWIARLSPAYNMNDGGLGNTGRSLTDEQKRHLSDIGSKQWALKTDAEKELIINNNLKGRSVGYNHSEATKEKLRAANLGKKMPKNVAKKIGQKNKVSMLGNQNGNKAVAALKDGEVIRTFESIVLAARFTGLNKTGISAVLNGRQTTSGGYNWQYA